MLRARFERRLGGMNCLRPITTNPMGSCLPAKPAAQTFLKAVATLSAASEQLLPWRVARVPVLLKNLITRLAVVLVVTLCPALFAQAQVNVDNDLISFKRWKSENGA